MKKFLLKSIAFFVASLIVFIIFWKFICFNRNEILKLPNDCNIVFLGNSHIEYTIDDSILKNSFNFARSAERMEFIYCKIKLLKHYNTQLDTVVIGYDNVLLYKGADKDFNTNAYSPYYYDTYNFNDIIQIIRNSSFDYIISHFSWPFEWSKLVPIITQKADENLKTSNLTNIGGYKPLFRNKLIEDIKLKQNRVQHQTSFDTLQLYFLNNVIEFCKKNNITIIFLCPPQHDKCHLDKTFYKEFYSKNYSNIKFYDFRDMHLPDSCFGDLDHLNYKGAKVFSEFLEKEVFHKNNYPH